MPVAMTTDIVYPLPGLVSIRFTPTTGNFVRVWATVAPQGSDYRRKLDSVSDVGRVVVFAGGITEVFWANLDVGGRYQFICQEYTHMASVFGGGYQRDPDSYPTETAVGAEVTTNIYIGERLTHRLGTGRYGFGDLVLWVWNDTVRFTSVQVHGETTPAVINPTTARAEVAANSSAVETAALNLVDQTTTALMGNIQSLLADMRSEIPLHFNNNAGAYHAVGADTENDSAIENIPLNPSTPEGYAFAARVIAQRLERHMGDVDNDWHTTSDYINAMLTPIPATSADMPSVWAAVADIYRAYEAHRVTTSSIHALQDTTNNLTVTPGNLLILHRDFLDAMQDLQPTAPEEANPAATDLFQWGFNRELD
jgi:hypothetical protein